MEKFFSHYDFVACLKTGIKSCGRNPASISCHSLRRGGATLSFACGLTCDEIKMASDVYRQYIFVSPVASLNMARILSKGAAGLPRN